MFAVATARGAMSAGVAATAKHFPGHGDTHVDSHLALPRIEKTKAQIKGEELVPFEALVAAGIPSVMTGHMALPLVTGDDTPCSLSRLITTGILRDELGFQGVVVTDCLEMDAVAEGPGVTEGAVKALEAGADVVMICHTYERHVEAIEGAYRAVEMGRLAVDDLRQSGTRIAKMKTQFAGGDTAEVAWEARFAKIHQESLQLSREAYPRSTTIVWNAGVIPLAAGMKDIALLTPKMEAVNRAVDPGDGTLVGANGVKNTAGAAYIALAQALEIRGRVRHVVFDEEDEIGIDGAACVIWVMRNADLKRWQLARLERLNLRAKGVPLILVSSCGPYDLAGRASEYADWTAYVATYEFTRAALEGLVEVLFGETEGSGRMPVSLNLI